jgi:hypothetical protein
MGNHNCTTVLKQDADAAEYYVYIKNVKNATSVNDVQKYYDARVKLLGETRNQCNKWPLLNELIAHDNIIVFKECITQKTISTLNIFNINAIINSSAVHFLTYLFTIPGFTIDIFHTNEIKNHLISRMIVSFEFMDILITNGFDINIQDKNGNTLMMKTCSSTEYCTYPYIKHLYENGASITIKNHLNQTCIDILNNKPIYYVGAIQMRNDILKLFRQVKNVDISMSEKKLII